jgi:hypothetical protein
VLAQPLADCSPCVLNGMRVLEGIQDRPMLADEVLVIRLVGPHAIREQGQQMENGC